MAMHLRKPTLALIVLLASCHADDDAGIVLNVDTEVTADRTTINRLVVSVDGNPQEWYLTRPLPGSLGIKTSAGEKYVTVDGFASTVPRGRWSGIVVASEGSVIVQDVHLTGQAPLDGGLLDGGAETVVRDGALDGSAEAEVRDGAQAERGLDVAADLGVHRDGPGVRDTSDADPAFPLLDAGLLDGSGIGVGDADGRGDGALDGSLVADSGPSTIEVGPPQPVPLFGTFAVRSPFDISASAAAPGPVRDAIDVVHVFVVNPGEAIIDFADRAGVPAASALRAALPSELMGQLADWMNTYIKSAGSLGVVPYDRLAWLDVTVRNLLLTWTLESRLTQPFAGSGTHSPRTLVFADPAGAPLTYALDPDLLTPATNVTSVLSWSSGASGPASATISDHTFALPFGRYASPALNRILLAQYETPNVAAYLSDAVGCAGMAATVASQCVSLACVGHEADLANLCEGGLAEGARQIDAQIQAIDFRAIRLRRGTATAVDAEITNPQKTSALRDGVWTATVDFGNGPEPASATFEASGETVAGP